MTPFFLSAKIVLAFSKRPTSVPKTIPPIAGDITASILVEIKLSAIIEANNVRYLGYCNTFAH